MKRLFSLLDNDKVLLVVSLLIAIGLWMVVIIERDPKIESSIKNVEISYLNTDNLDASGLNIISVTDKTADVKISGRRSEVYPVSEKNLVTTVNMADIRAPGYYELPVSVTQTKTSVLIENIEPKNITVRIDYINTNRRDIEVRYKGSPAEGFEIEKYTPSVTSVTVEGPENALAKIAKVIAEVDVSGIKESCDLQADLKLIDSSGIRIDDPDVKMSSQSATVSLNVIQVKTVPVQVILDGEVDLEQSGISIASQPAEVIIKGSNDIVSEIEKIETEAIEHIPDTDAEISANLILPDGIVCETEAVTVAFTFNEAEETTE